MVRHNRAWQKMGNAFNAKSYPLDATTTTTGGNIMGKIYLQRKDPNFKILVLSIALALWMVGQILVLKRQIAVNNSMMELITKVIKYKTL